MKYEIRQILYSKDIFMTMIHPIISNKATNKKSHQYFIDGILKNGATNGARTHDNRDHNPGLYQLSYSRHSNAGIWRAWQDSNLRPPA